MLRRVLASWLLISSVGASSGCSSEPPPLALPTGGASVPAFGPPWINEPTPSRSEWLASGHSLIPDAGDCPLSFDYQGRAVEELCAPPGRCIPVKAFGVPAPRWTGTCYAERPRAHEGERCSPVIGDNGANAANPECELGLACWRNEEGVPVCHNPR